MIMVDLGPIEIAVQTLAHDLEKEGLSYGDISQVLDDIGWIYADLSIGYAVKQQAVDYVEEHRN